MFLHQSKLNCPHLSLSLISAYWNATRAFMILSAMSCFAGIIAGILSFAHFSAFERFNRSFAAGIMFFISSKSFLSRCLYRQIMNIRSHLSFSLCLLQRSLFCSLWPSTPGWRSTSWGSVLVTGVSHGPTFWAGLLCSWPSLLVSKGGCV